jgi:hypothetical protein
MLSIKNMFKNVKLATLFVFVLISLFLIASSIFYVGTKGVIVTDLSNSKCVNVKVGSLITQIEGEIINDVEKFNQSMNNLKAGQSISMIVDSGPANCVVLNDGNLGLKVKNTISGVLRFGTDIGGGSIFVFKPANEIPESDMTKIVETIGERIKFFGIPQTKVYKDGNLIKIESFKDLEPNMLVMVGKLETKILQEIVLENGTGKIKIGSEPFLIKINDKINVNGIDYSLEEKFKINNISFNLVNSTEDFAIVSADVYSNGDINSSQMQFGVVKKVAEGAFQFTVPIELSANASNRFSLITRGVGVSRQPGRESVLNGKLVFYIDNSSITIPLDIPIEFVGKPISVIVGFEKTEHDANKQMKNVQAVLSFGQLPEKLILVKEEEVKPKVGMFDFGVLIAILAISVMTFVFVSYARYKKIKTSFVAVMLAIVELICVVGVIVFLQRFSSYGVVMDFSVLIGLIVSALLTLTKMLILTEEDFRKLHLDIKYKYKKVIGLGNLLSICSVVIAISSIQFGYGGFGSVLLIGLLVELLLIKAIYKDLLKKSLG